MKHINKDEIVQELPWPGVLTCQFKHKISATEASLKYQGPKISYEEWHKVMSFFRWTNDTAHSESQVRGFVDPIKKALVFWAFPQTAGTGMTTKEIEGEEFNKQRAALPNAGSLIYFMTIHHHCNFSAFQSGGDSNNEERPGGGAHETGQEGLHLTVGNMGSDRHDIHARVYLDTVKMDPNMSAFWDIGEQIASLLPPDMHDKIARFQMCEKVDVAFPDEWKKNYMEVKSTVSSSLPSRYVGGFSYGTSTTGYGISSYRNLFERIDDSSEEIVEDILDKGLMDVPDFELSLKFLIESTLLNHILDVGSEERYDAFDTRNLIKKIAEAYEDYKKDWAGEEVGELNKSEKSEVEKGVDTKGNTRKNRKRRKQRHEDATTTSAQASTESLKHGQTNGNGKHWDADLQCMVDDWTGYMGVD